MSLVKPILKEYQPVDHYQQELAEYESQVRRRRIWAVLLIGFVMIPCYLFAFMLAGIASMSVGSGGFYGHEDDFRDKMDWLWHDRVIQITKWGGLT